VLAEFALQQRRHRPVGDTLHRAVKMPGSHLQSRGDRWRDRLRS
jgi:hypothetical protein